MTAMMALMSLRFVRRSLVPRIISHAVTVVAFWIHGIVIKKTIVVMEVTKPLKAVALLMLRVHRHISSASMVCAISCLTFHFIILMKRGSYPG